MLLTLSGVITLLYALLKYFVSKSGDYASIHYNGIVGAVFDIMQRENNLHSLMPCRSYAHVLIYVQRNQQTILFLIHARIKHDKQKKN
jgi:hypothetical protein